MPSGNNAITQLEEKATPKITGILMSISPSPAKGPSPVERGLSHLTGLTETTRAVINDLMCNMRVSFSEVADACGVSTGAVREAVRIDRDMLGGLESDGLITFTDDEISVTETGAFFIRNVAAALDREYREAVQTYSKPV
jgi:oxygen-independent coproporphyrinogen-3 oxidase